MNKIAVSVSTSLLAFCTQRTVALDILKEGVRLLAYEKLNGTLKKEILIEIIKLFAYGDDKQQGTLDDRLSKETIGVLITLIESGTIDFIIDGIVKDDYSVFRKCLKRLFG